MADIVYLGDDDLSSYDFSQSSCCIGVFDGVHKGHHDLIDKTIEDAKTHAGKAIVITFDRDPEELICPDGVKKIMSNSERIAELAKATVDVVAVLAFTPAFSRLSPSAFLERLFGCNPPCSIHVGYDFRFGAQAAGTVKDISAWGEGYGVSVTGHDLLEQNGEAITATRIRKLLTKGDLDQANALLGRPFCLSGTVELGRQEGATFGFRTANLTFDAARMLLADGVYACKAQVDGKTYKAAASMGVSPTFAQTATANCEVHLLDFDSDIYGETISVEYLKRLRPMLKFDDVDALIQTVKNDIDWVRNNIEL